MFASKELSKLYCLKLPIMVIMRDMPFLNTLVCFCGGLSDTSPTCQLCNIVLDDCDDQYEPYEVTDSHC